MTASSVLYMQELLNKCGVWVQAVKKATPLIHPQFSEHASIEVHVLKWYGIETACRDVYVETCMSLKLCLCMLLVIIMVEILMKSWKASIWSIRGNWLMYSKLDSSVYRMDVKLIYTCDYACSQHVDSHIISITRLKEILLKQWVYINTKQTLQDLLVNIYRFIWHNFISRN